MTRPEGGAEPSRKTLADLVAYPSGGKARLKGAAQRGRQIENRQKMNADARLSILHLSDGKAKVLALN
jgi:Mg-chelatase subunit ChlD